ncbi:hypothetical protein AVEN_222125-1 [Araneus ventricosus]|uniref:Uncharacterized protein n=1 Tax=Araneus ventricosus TaxID=182803 RepID=A0A4Y2DVS2_ARAVE|nr:hypothetical protein AVEN_222125-1 [Araneus ventricosus]
MFLLEQSCSCCCVVSPIYQKPQKKKTNDKTKTFLLTSEFEEAQNVILKYFQDEAFAEEIQRLKINKPIKTHSKLLALCPYLDENEILRVGGRLRHAKLHENQWRFSAQALEASASYFENLGASKSMQHTSHC